MKRTKASRGRKRQKRRRKRDTGFPAVLHSWGRMNGRCTLEHELSLSPSVNARLHGARTCPLAIYTEWPPVTWVLNTSIHARSGRIKASHVQFHGTKIFFRGISILLPAPLRRPRVKPLFGTLVEGRLSRLPLSTSPHLQHNARGSACATHEDRHRISGLTRDDDGQGWVTMRRDNDLDAKNVIRKFSLYADILILWSRRYNISRDEGFN